VNKQSKIVPDETGETPPHNRRAWDKGWVRPALMISVPLLLLAAGAIYWILTSRFESTENAYVQQNMVSIAPEVAGRIIAVKVRENQQVKAGDVLFTIDDAPYRIALAEAEASLADARIRVSQLRSAYVARGADVGAKLAELGARNADLQLAQENLARQTKLLKDGFTTRARYDEAVRAVAAARANVAAARAEAAAAQADAIAARDALGTGGAEGQPALLAAQAIRDRAALNLEWTVVHAPQDGIVSQADRLQTGQMAVQGMPLLSLVVAGDAWIEANFKETQLDRMRVGQPARIKIDAFPGQEFDAVVTSIGAGTGSQFSVLPAQNASGNWIKVVQRVPVRLRLQEKPAQPLVAGLSAEVRVDVRD